MNKNELVKNLKKEIQDIYSKINEFENADQIHLIDIDLALSKVRNLYELLSKLNPQTFYTPENQKEEISTKTKQPENIEVESPVEDQKVEPEVKIEKEPDTTEDKKVYEEKPVVSEPELIIETPGKDEYKEEIEAKAETEADEYIKEKEVHKKTVKEHNGKNTEIIADKFQSKKFIHDDIAMKNSKQDVSSKMQSKPINDINSAIGLNDKFIFIRELFDGDKDHYNETIQILNNFDSYQNAVSFLDENFDWDSEDQNYERLKELVQRKYASK